MSGMDKRDTSEVAKRLELFSTRHDRCVLWTAGKQGEGYGVIALGPRSDRRYYLTHRVAFELAYGSPIGVVRHSCDTPACINPHHLWDGTQGDNVQDAVRRGRMRSLSQRVLADDQVTEIRLLSEDGFSQRKIADYYDVSRCVVQRILEGLTYREIS